MKPDTGFEMEEEPYDPRELFADIALLITEARTPDLSKKGRVEGPHCPPVQGSREHDCDRHKEQCRKASDILTQNKILLRNNIPMRIDVLLFPACEHGLREETVVVGAMFSTVDTFILLERWDVQLIYKRTPERQEGYVGGRSLLQAARSYLHFSELSSWLISSGGLLPFRVVYRVYAPGESVGYTFEMLPEVHNFPISDLGEAIMRASVTHLPRKNTMVSLFCRSPSPSSELHGRLRKMSPDELSQSPDSKTLRKSPELKGASGFKMTEDYFGYPPPGASSRRHSKDHMEYGKQGEMEQHVEGLAKKMVDKPPSGKSFVDSKLKLKEAETALPYLDEGDPFKMDEISSVLQECEILQAGGQKKEMYYSHLATRLSNNQEAKIPRIPPTSLPIQKSLPSDVKTTKLPGQMSPQKCHPYRKPTALYTLSTGSHPAPFQLTRRLPSPKVLMTASKKPEPSGYRKKRLDYSEGKPSQDIDDDDFSSFKQLEELTVSDMQDLARPLSPNQLDAYLSSLSNELPKKTSLLQLDEIPTTKCRFFIGESEKSDDVFESPKEEHVRIDKGALTLHDSDLKLKFTAQSLSQNNAARADNSSISSLSMDNSELQSLSDQRVSKGDHNENSKGGSLKGCEFKNRDVDISNTSLSQTDSFRDENSNNSNIKTELECQDNEPRNISEVKSTEYKYIDTPETQTHMFSPTRRRFHKSLSTSEVENDLTTRKSLKKDIRKLKTESKDPATYWDNVQNTAFQEKNNKFQENKIENPEFSDISVSSSYHVSSAYSKDEKVKYSKLDNNNKDSENASVVDKKVTKHNLDGITIPCSVGSSQTKDPASVSSSKYIEICADQTKNISQNGFQDLSLAQNGSLSSINSSPSPKNESYSNSEGSPTPVSGSPNVDDEVLHHLKQSLNQSSPKQTSLKRGSNSDLPDIGLSLCKQLLKKGFQQSVENETRSSGKQDYKNLPTPDDIQRFQFNVARSASALFNSNTGLPTRSSPAPIKRKSSSSFDYDCTLVNVRAIKNAVSCSRLSLQCDNKDEKVDDPKIISTSAPASTHCLLGNFEESMLNGRLEPVGVVDGFTAEIGAGGSFCPKHITLPVAAYFFQLSDDNAPSPYLGHVNLDALGKRGYHIPRTGTVQVTLFNPNKTVVKMFVVMYDLSDMPPSCQTFLRQRTMYMPVDKNSPEPSFLRYLIHLRFASTKSGKIYLHTDIRLIFARDKFEFDPRVANYELRSFTEGPENPKFSPKR